MAGLPPPSGLRPATSPANAGEDFSVAAVRLAGFATVVLGWVPDVFWSSTPAELAAVTAVLAGDAPAPLDTRAVAALMREFPDA